MGNFINFFHARHLEIAYRAADYEKTKELIVKKIGINEKMSNGEYPLIDFCYEKYYEERFAKTICFTELQKIKLKNLLLKNVSDRNVRQHHTGRTLIYLAVSNNDINFVKKILKYGVDVNLKDTYNLCFTPLHSTCVNGNLNMAKLLIENKADVNSKDNLNFTPLRTLFCHSILSVRVLHNDIVENYTQNKISIMEMLIDHNSEEISVFDEQVTHKCNQKLLWYYHKLIKNRHCKRKYAYVIRINRLLYNQCKSFTLKRLLLELIVHCYLPKYEIENDSKETECYEDESDHKGLVKESDDESSEEEESQEEKTGEESQEE